MAAARFAEDAASVFLMFEEREDVEAARRDPMDREDSVRGFALICPRMVQKFTRISLLAVIMSFPS